MYILDMRRYVHFFVYVFQNSDEDLQFNCFSDGCNNGSF